MPTGWVTRIGAVAAGAAAWIGILTLSRRALGVESPMFAATTVGSSLGFVVITTPWWPWRLPKWWERIRPWERGGAVHRRWGAHLFGTLLRRPPLRYFNTTVYRRNRPGGLPELHRQLLYAESAHFWAAALTLPLLLYGGWLGSWRLLASWTFVNAATNLYPILHLRLVRGRLENLFPPAAPADLGGTL